MTANTPPPAIPGLHHVTAIAKDPQANLRFYRDVLGLRLIKRTVNFDDPGTWHLYYGDAAGTAGSVLTFFAYPNAARGVAGTGTVIRTDLRVPERSLDWWADHLAAAGTEATFVGSATVPSDERRALLLHDPDGLPLALVPSGDAGEDGPRAGGSVPERHAVRGIDGVRMLGAAADLDATTWWLRDVLGFRHSAASQGEEHGLWHAPGGGPGSRVELVASATARPGRVAAGSVHHIAWRVPDDAAQSAWRSAIADTKLFVTPPQDRHYFRSIYVREPGGVLFELATDGPGFTVDEDEQTLGTTLRLPPWLEERRAEIEGKLPSLES